MSVPRSVSRRLGLAIGWATLVAVGVDEGSAQRVALDVSAGSVGPGVAVHVGLTPRLNLRLSGHHLPLSRSGVFTDDANDVDVAYEADLTVGGASALLDWHPTGGGFHLTAGAFYNRTEGNFSGAPTSPYKYDDQKTFSVERLGTLSGSVTYASSVAPYVGLGFGNPLSSRVSFLFDVGALYTGAPEVTLQGTGLIAPTANHATTINEGISTFTWYPVLSFGLGFRLAGGGPTPQERP